MKNSKIIFLVIIENAENSPCLFSIELIRILGNFGHEIFPPNISENFLNYLE